MLPERGAVVPWQVVWELLEALALLAWGPSRNQLPPRASCRSIPRGHSPPSPHCQHNPGHPQPQASTARLRAQPRFASPCGDIWLPVAKSRGFVPPAVSLLSF